MASSFAGGTLRVSTPSSYDAEPASRTRTRDLPRGPEGRAVASKDAIVAALEDAGLDQVERVDLTPRATRDIDGKPAINRAGNVRLEVDVPPGEDAVVLLEHDGVYSWHLPVNPAERTRALDNEPRTARFEITVQPRPSRRRKPTETKGDRRTKGILGDLVQGAAQALVFRFVAPAILEKAIEKMEEHVRPGLLHLAD